MPTPDITITRASEPSSAPPEFFWEDVPGIRQHNLGVTADPVTYYPIPSGTVHWMTETIPPVFFSEGSNFDPKYAIRSVFGGSGYQTILIGAETSILKGGFPAQQWQLSQEYGELKETLRELAALEEEDDWRIEESVYAAASYYATELRSGSIPAPQVSVHGPKSVVFNWSNGFYNLYLTISANNVSALLSSPERIIQRKEFSKTALASPLALLYFGS